MDYKRLHLCLVFNFFYETFEQLVKRLTGWRRAYETAQFIWTLWQKKNTSFYPNAPLILFSFETCAEVIKNLIFTKSIHITTAYCNLYFASATRLNTYVAFFAKEDKGFISFINRLIVDQIL